MEDICERKRQESIEVFRNINSFGKNYFCYDFYRNREITTIVGLNHKSLVNLVNEIKRIEYIDYMNISVENKIPCKYFQEDGSLKKPFKYTKKLTKNQFNEFLKLLRS